MLVPLLVLDLLLAAVLAVLLVRRARLRAQAREASERLRVVEVATERAVAALQRGADRGDTSAEVGTGDARADVPADRRPRRRVRRVGPPATPDRP